MREFSWPEVEEYWRNHADERAPLEAERDPDALNNVCSPGVPRFRNEYSAANQRRTFDRLLGQLPGPHAGEAALDVGCGSARWCIRLDSKGYEVTGIDLQPALIDYNRKRLPQIEFHCRAAQDFHTERTFGLITSVTVLGHNPRPEQEALVEHLRSLTAPDGHALVLENVRDRGAHIFANSRREWIELFARHGFELVALQRYDFNPTLRLLERLKRLLLRTRPREISPSTLNKRRPGSSPHSWRRQAQVAAERAAVIIDRALEPAFTASGLPLSSTHCGFLFRAT